MFFFEKCSRNDHGGAIYFSCSGSIVQRRFCARGSSLTKENCKGCFSYSSFTQAMNADNIITDCTISQCVDECSKGTLYSISGNNLLLNSNITNVEIIRYTAHCFARGNNETVVKYLNFQNNYQGQGINTAFYTENVNSNYEYCNIINNRDKPIFFVYRSNCTIKNCTIYHGNTETIIFGGSGKFKINITNCTFDVSPRDFQYPNQKLSVTAIIIDQSLNYGFYYYQFPIDCNEVNKLIYEERYTEQIDSFETERYTPKQYATPKKHTMLDPTYIHHPLPLNELLSTCSIYTLSYEFITKIH